MESVHTPMSYHLSVCLFRLAYVQIYSPGGITSQVHFIDQVYEGQI